MKLNIRFLEVNYRNFASANEASNMDLSTQIKLLHKFRQSVAHIELPKRFTHMFYYEPHPLCRVAAAEVQAFLESQKHWNSEFGLGSSPDGGAGNAHGKMIGVLVVKTPDGELGYLAAFSGNTYQEEAYQFFVPMVYELPPGENFFSREIKVIQAVANEINELKYAQKLTDAQENLVRVKKAAREEMNRISTESKRLKVERAQKRKIGKRELSAIEYEKLLNDLSMESQAVRYRVKAARAEQRQRMQKAENQLSELVRQIDDLKKKRAQLSASLQQKLFDKYRFLNRFGEEKSVNQIFDFVENPPSGAGDCAAPKLLQYAFLNHLTPVAMAEFWWGKSPTSTIRIHKKYYPSCTNKCKPILKHMLSGIPVDPNPLEKLAKAHQDLERLYEDDEIVIVNKPYGMLSVPGKEISDSVITRLAAQYGGSVALYPVHRLDMGTSGVLMVAKTEKAHKNLQKQFLNKTVLKRYVAVLEGYTKTNSGQIELPLRVDLDNRPSQMVCYQHGKPALTRYKVIRKKKGYTRVHLFPVTGRTHQLRVHCAHPDGLNHAIKGDVLYGQKADRLYLHAEVLEFNHPATNERIRVVSNPDF